MKTSCANGFRRHWMQNVGRLAWASAVTSVLPLAVGCSMRDKQPAFQFTLLDGSRHDSNSLRGRVTLVNFWATTCAICVAEMPEWVRLHQQLRPSGGFDILAVAMSYDPPARVAEFAETRRLPFGVVIDNTGAVAKAFGDVRATPSLFLLDPNGRIAHSYIGKVDVAAVRRDIGALSAKS
jgi:peroxiredoxin